MPRRLTAARHALREDAPPHAALSRDLAAAGSSLPSGLGRIAALVGVGAIGAAALGVAGPAVTRDSSVRLTAATARPAVPAPAPEAHAPVRQPHAPAADRPDREQRAVPHADRPAEPAPQAQQPAAAQAGTSTSGGHVEAAPRAAQPWLPRGIGMWIYEWDRTGGGDAHRVVARARQVGLSTLYLRTGSSSDGLDNTAALRSLLSATGGTGISVVAWDFPTLRHPVRDARRLAAAARVGRTGDGPRVAAVAPDIETPAEGTFNAAWRVRTYLAALRQHLPADVSVLGTVPWPSRYRIGDYPYQAVAARSDALIPMAYWYDNPPAEVTARSISYLRRFHRPVQPVGQAYDGKIDVPSLRHNHLSREVPRFFATAHRHGARAVSLWSWQAAPPTAWRALERAHHLFPARSAGTAGH